MRFFIAIIACFSLAAQYSQNIGLSVAIVCMVNHTAVDLLTKSGTSPIEQFQNGSFRNQTRTFSDVKLK